MDKKTFRSLAKDLDFSACVGVDLAGSEKRNTGVAFVDNNSILTFIIKSNDELFEFKSKFKFFYIDAPLSLPKGRDSLEVRNERHFRECDLLLKQRGIKFFPATLGPMRMLTQRAISIKEELEKSGKEVYEVFPGAFYDVFGVKRKDRASIHNLFLKLCELFGLCLKAENLSQDELDAIACLFTGLFHRMGLAEPLTGDDGTIIIPEKKVKNFLNL